MHKAREHKRIELLRQELYDRLIPISDPDTRLAFHRILKGNHHVVMQPTVWSRAPILAPSSR